ncbi:MAG TPA: hypothetical protein VGE40_06745 [Bacilli bacterium]
MKASLHDFEHFKNPPSAYRTAPFWVWNDAMTAEQIRRQLEQLYHKGFGGAFIHPRPGLVTEYLSNDWFKLWKIALEEAKKLDMKLYIYYENSYPSGFAGGHVSAELPDCLARSITLRFLEDIEHPEQLYQDVWVPEAKRPVKIYSFTREGDKIHLLRDLTELPDTEWNRYGTNFMVMEWESSVPTPWLGGFAYPDLLRREVADQFIKSTYEPYYARFGADFGTTIPAIFTDEPAISPGSVFVEDHFTLPFSFWFAAEFARRNGYSLLDNMVSLFIYPTGNWQGIPCTKVRYDYYCTMRELWIQNFIKPISEWCESRHIAWTGHFMEHQWPYPWGQCSPSVMSIYEYMQWPAIDMLLSHMLKKDGTDPMLVTIKEVSSAANQFGKERVL